MANHRYSAGAGSLAGACLLAGLVVAAGCGRLGYQGGLFEDGPDGGIPPDSDGGILPNSDGGANAVDPACDSSAPNPRSIGDVAAPLSETGTLMVVAGACTVTFSEAIPTEVGVGDRLVVGGESLYVARVLPPGQLVVHTPPAQDLIDQPFTIERSYPGAQEWYDDRAGDLVGEDRNEVGVMYRDTPVVLGRGLVFSGATTDETHVMRLTVAEGHGHGGRAGAGVRLDGNQTECYGIEIRDHFVQVDGLEIARFGPPDPCGPAGVVVFSNDVLLTGLLIHSYKAAIENGSAAVRLTNSGTASATVRNTIAYYGINGFRNPGPGALYVENSTIWAMQRHGTRLSHPEGQVVVTNTIATDCGIRDFGESQAGFNISSDDSADGVGSIPFQAPEDLFVSTTDLAEDLHLRPGAVAIDAAADMSWKFTTDLDGQSRPANGWDIGADEMP